MANVNHLVDALAKIRWGASGDWSVSLKPDECGALLSILPEDSIVIKTLGAKDEPRDKSRSESGQLPGYLSGDPDDEQPEE